MSVQPKDEHQRFLSRMLSTDLGNVANEYTLAEQRAVGAKAASGGKFGTGSAVDDGGAAEALVGEFHAREGHLGVGAHLGAVLLGQRSLVRRIPAGSEGEDSVLGVDVALNIRNRAACLGRREHAPEGEERGAHGHEEKRRRKVKLQRRTTLSRRQAW